MNTKIVLLFILICYCAAGQSQLVPIGTSFKDQLYKKKYKHIISPNKQEPRKMDVHVWCKKIRYFTPHQNEKI